MADFRARWKKSGGGAPCYASHRWPLKRRITAEQYLHMTFEHDAEFVHGEIVKRAMPDKTHSTIQFRILMEVGRLIQSDPLFPYPELRLRLEPRVFRIPDISVFGGQPPRGSVPSTPPLLVIEIFVQRRPPLQPHGETRRISRLGRFQHLGGRIRFLKRFSVYTESGLQNVSSLSARRLSAGINSGRSIFRSLEQA